MGTLLKFGLSYSLFCPQGSVLKHCYCYSVVASNVFSSHTQQNVDWVYALCEELVKMKLQDVATFQGFTVDQRQ